MASLSIWFSLFEAFATWHLNGATNVTLSPSSGSIGSTVLITGINLTSASQVFFNGTSATVPNGATNGLVTVTVSSGTLTSLTTSVSSEPPLNGQPDEHGPADQLSHTE